MCLPHLHFLDDFVDIEQDFDFALYLGQTQQIRRGGADSKIGRVFDIGGLQGQDFRNAVDDDAGGDAACLAFDLNHDDAGALRVVRFRHSKLQAEIHHRNNFSTQVQHPFDMERNLRNSGNLLHAHDFADMEDLDSKLLFSELESQI